METSWFPRDFTAANGLVGARMPSRDFPLSNLERQSDAQTWDMATISSIWRFWPGFPFFDSSAAEAGTQADQYPLSRLARRSVGQLCKKEQMSSVPIGTDRLALAY